MNQEQIKARLDEINEERKTDLQGLELSRELLGIRRSRFEQEVTALERGIKILGSSIAELNKEAHDLKLQLPKNTSIAKKVGCRKYLTSPLIEVFNSLQKAANKYSPSASPQSIAKSCKSTAEGSTGKHTRAHGLLWFYL